MFLYVMTLGVTDEYRHRGIGTVLMKSLVAACKRSFVAIFLHVLSSNMRALAFYEKLGFERHCLLTGCASLPPLPPCLPASLTKQCCLEY